MEVLPTVLQPDRFGANVVERKCGKTSSQRDLCPRAGSGHCRRGPLLLPEPIPILGAVDGEYRNRPGVRGVLLEIPAAAIGPRLPTRHVRPSAFEANESAKLQIFG